MCVAARLIQILNPSISYQCAGGGWLSLMRLDKIDSSPVVLLKQAGYVSNNTEVDPMYDNSQLRQK